MDVQLGPASSTFTVSGPGGESAQAEVPLPGPFNVSNALAAITALVTAGLPLAAAVAGVAAAPGVPGRLERVDAGQEYVAVVDYAHKPDALQAVLASLREVTKGRLHVVIGCGGDRDPFKRGPMGAIAARLADTAVLTSDNPRSEDPLTILASMLAGAAEVPEAERGEVLVVPDRAEAIADAVARAHPGTPCWWPARATSWASTSRARYARSTTGRCCARPLPGTPIPSSEEWSSRDRTDPGGAGRRDGR